MTYYTTHALPHTKHGRCIAHTYTRHRTQNVNTSHTINMQKTHTTHDVDHTHTHTSCTFVPKGAAVLVDIIVVFCRHGDQLLCVVFVRTRSVATVKSRRQLEVTDRRGIFEPDPFDVRVCAAQSGGKVSKHIARFRFTQTYFISITTVGHPSQHSMAMVLQNMAVH